ncbi:MAG TPA: HAD family hydrolase, partial [Chthoniobacteraceae bacterium]|nr:HAD family hydrolase [Chthoniobacteraceae bacterium]
MPPGTVKNIIFDLDGTLVDSLPGIEESARAAIGRVLPGEPMPDLRAAIGPPVAAMFASLWPDLPPKRSARLLAEFRAHYGETGCLRSQPYPQVGEVLARLHAAGMSLFLLTNKPLRPTQKILDHFELAKFFDDIATPDSPQPFDSKPAGARMLAVKFSLQPDVTVLVGDGKDDAASAAECGFTFFAAAYGYGVAATNASIRLEKFSEI